MTTREKLQRTGEALAEATHAHLEAIAEAVDGIGDDTLPAGEQVHALPSGTVRVQGIYGFRVRIGFGPRYFNTDTPGLDVPELTVNGKTYGGPATFYIDRDTGEVDLGMEGHRLTRAAQGKVADLVRALLAEWVEAAPELAGDHREACDRHERIRALRQQGERVAGRTPQA